MSGSVFWDAATAIGTVAMSFFTYRMIRQNKIQQKDAARPVLILMPFDGVDPLNRSGLLSPRATSTQSDGTYSYQIHCTLKNVGVGPALNVRLHLRFMNNDDYGTSRELAPLATGEAWRDALNPISLPLNVSETFNATDFQSGPGLDWKMVLEYEDVFGNHFHTVHAKSPQMPWIACGIGRAPVVFQAIGR